MLNSNYYTVIIICYNENITAEKIFRVKSFLCGLSDGYFFLLNSYQQIKQILMSFQTQNFQDNFTSYNFENIEYIL